MNDQPEQPERLKNLVHDLEVMAWSLDQVVIEARNAGITDAMIRSFLDQILDLPPSPAGLPSDDGYQMTEVQIWINSDKAVSGLVAVLVPEQAREAVNLVLGPTVWLDHPDRKLEPTEDGLGWLVELNGKELAVARAQGYLEVSKGQYLIRTCQ